jgi:hypothetical protein
MNYFSRNINRVAAKWRHEQEHKHRLLRAFPQRAPLAAEMRESKPATKEPAI